MKVYIHTNGCAVLKHETERIAKFFHLNKVEIVECPEDGDLIVMTCCGVTHNEENQAIDIISNLNSRKQKDATLIVSGCLPAFASERILEVAPEAQLMSYSQMRNFDSIVSGGASWDDVYYNYGHMMKQEEHRDDTIHSSNQDMDLQLMKTVDETNHTSNCIQQY